MLRKPPPPPRRRVSRVLVKLWAGPVVVLAGTGVARSYGLPWGPSFAAGILVAVVLLVRAARRAALAGLGHLIVLTGAAGLRLLIWTTTGRARHVAAPVWLALLAVALPSRDSTAWTWASTAAAVEFIPAAWWPRLIGGRDLLSARERRIVACVLAGLAFTVLAAAPLGYLSTPRVAVISGVVLAGAVPWWRVRRTRPAPDTPAILVRWADDVAAAEPRLAGEWLEYDDDRGAGVLKLDTTTASEAAKLDERAEFLLDVARGSVTLAADPRLSVRCVRVAFTEPGHGGRLQYRDGATLQPDGQFVTLTGVGDQPIYGRLWRPDGRACHIAIIAPTGGGKGGCTRHIVLEAAPHPLVGLVGCDGKRGAGLGYLRGGMLTLATDPDAWRQTITGFADAMMDRADRFGADDRDSFDPTPEDPYLFLVLGELPEILARWPGLGKPISRIAKLGASLGMGLVMELQKADGPSYGDTGTRANVLDGGWIYAGPATDAQARTVMLQGHDFDPATLPPDPGWWAVLGRVLGDQPTIPGRQLWTPNRRDVHRAITARQGEDRDQVVAEVCPFGAVEDWLARDYISPAEGMHERTLQILGLIDTPAVAPAGDETTTPPAREGRRVSDPTPDITNTDTASSDPDSWERIRRVLEDARHSEPDGLLRGQIADRAGVSAGHTSEILRRHTGEVVQDTRARWKLAA